MTPDEVITVLLELGFSERRAFGGRLRYALLGTDLRTTVGPRTVNVYFTNGDRPKFILNAKTRQLTAQVLYNTVIIATGKQTTADRQDDERTR